MSDRDFRVGVALCGAELAGPAHVGVLHGLQQLGVRVSAIAGSSAGALVASLYAHGYTMADFAGAIDRFPGVLLMDYGFPVASSLFNVVSHRWRRQNVSVPRGVFRGKRLHRLIVRAHQGRLPRLPLYVVATDLRTTKAIAFTNDPAAVQSGHAVLSSDLPKEILASCAIPGIVTPVRHRQWLLVDGGVRDMIPVSILRDVGCDRIIAVNVHRLADDWYPVTTVNVLQRSLATLLDEATASSDLAGSDVFVLNPKLEPTSWLSSHKPMHRNVDLAYQHVLGQQHSLLPFLRPSP